MIKKTLSRIIGSIKFAKPYQKFRFNHVNEPLQLLNNDLKFFNENNFTVDSD